MDINDNLIKISRSIKGIHNINIYIYIKMSRKVITISIVSFFHRIWNGQQKLYIQTRFEASPRQMFYL